jgi:acyl-CoA reductase-like NAD-dependent aldehyde dehydrogenase
MLEVRDLADVRSVVGEVPAMTAADVAAAYSLAGTAFATWRRTGPLDRAAVLARCADLSRARAEEQAAPGPRIYTWVKTAAVRHQW